MDLDRRDPSTEVARNSQSAGDGSGWIVWLATAVLVILKLTDVIDWSWWLVLAGVWVPPAGLVALVLLVVTGGLIYSALELLMERRR